MRYYTPDEKGERRHERNERFGEPSPLLIIPEAGQYIWNWYFSLSDRLRRVRDGLCEPIPPSEFMAWKEATRIIVYATEYAILCAMDVAYCDEMNKELKDYRARQQAEAEAEAAKGSKGRKR